MHIPNTETKAQTLICTYSFHKIKAASSNTASSLLFPLHYDMGCGPGDEGMGRTPRNI